jgi:hypothetical protein
LQKPAGVKCLLVIKTKTMRPRILFLILIFLTGCTSRGCQRWKKEAEYDERHYHIEQYSGGKLVEQYDFHGILNDSKNSDGYFFFKGDTLIEVSGDIQIKSWD